MGCPVSRSLVFGSDMSLSGRLYIYCPEIVWFVRHWDQKSRYLHKNGRTTAIRPSRCNTSLVVHCGNVAIFCKLVKVAELLRMVYWGLGTGVHITLAIVPQPKVLTTQPANAKVKNNLVHHSWLYNWPAKLGLLRVCRLSSALLSRNNCGISYLARCQPRPGISLFRIDFLFLCPTGISK